MSSDCLEYMDESNLYRKARNSLDKTDFAYWWTLEVIIRFPCE